MARPVRIYKWEAKPRGKRCYVVQAYTHRTEVTERDLDRGIGVREIVEYKLYAKNIEAARRRGRKAAEAWGMKRGEKGVALKVVAWRCQDRVDTWDSWDPVGERK